MLLTTVRRDDYPTNYDIFPGDKPFSNDLLASMRVSFRHPPRNLAHTLIYTSKHYFVVVVSIDQKILDDFRFRPNITVCGGDSSGVSLISHPTREMQSNLL